MLVSLQHVCFERYANYKLIINEINNKNYTPWVSMLTKK